MVAVRNLLYVLAATLLMACNAASAEKLGQAVSFQATSRDVSIRTLAAKSNEGTSKRFLRLVDATEQDGDDAAEEERGIQVAVLSKLSKWATKMKLPKTATNLQFRAWLKGGKDPTDVYDILKFTGKDLKLVTAEPKYQLYLDYSAIWNALGGRYMT